MEELELLKKENELLKQKIEELTNNNTQLLKEYAEIKEKEKSNLESIEALQKENKKQLDRLNLYDNILPTLTRNEQSVEVKKEKDFDTLLDEVFTS